MKVAAAKRGSVPKSGKSKTVVHVPDLTEVESGYSNLPDGDYTFKVAKAEKAESQSGNDMIVWDFEVTEGKHKGGKIRDYTSLSANALWKLKGYLEAMNFELPESAFDLDLADLVDEQVMGRVEQEEYEGKMRARLVDVYAVGGEGETTGEDEAAEEEEAKPAKKAGKAEPAKKSKVKTYTEDEVMEMDEDALGELITTEELEVDLDEHPTIRKKRNAVIEALEGAKKMAAAE